jgi:hypothetical protein
MNRAPNILTLASVFVLGLKIWDIPQSRPNVESPVEVGKTALLDPPIGKVLVRSFTRFG